MKLNKQTSHKSENEAPTTHHLKKTTIEEKIIFALKCGLKVVASVRGFRTAFSPIVFYYIELNGIDDYHDTPIVELGFWPGLTKNLQEAEDALMQIKKAYKGVDVVHLNQHIQIGLR